MVSKPFDVNDDNFFTHKNKKLKLSYNSVDYINYSINTGYLFWKKEFFRRGYRILFDSNKNPSLGLKLKYSDNKYILLSKVVYLFENYFTSWPLCEPFLSFIKQRMNNGLSFSIHCSESDELKPMNYMTKDEYFMLLDFVKLYPYGINLQEFSTTCSWPILIDDFVAFMKSNLKKSKDKNISIPYYPHIY